MLTPDELDAIRGAAANGFVMSQAIIAHIDGLAARIAELELDAARYFRLRDGLVAHAKGFEHYVGNAVGEVLARGLPTEQMLDGIDAAIDAAMTT
ncbi:hypothetical protein [Chromobacterium haemolyticum]|uniref:hypothetical protein n=1 Tax=Chromobacterium haemolyticum TaxID=394935 RepID=UPI001318EF6C|nr:hypothetical protein [Chromobacterium haemolyticum]BBH13432.1 hypothetical protein CH06BL_26800 [Chromobacterium haemolyticum]